MKGFTNIPFARQTAELISLPSTYIPDYSNKNGSFWIRTLHFEYRYWSIDYLLKDLTIKNILEFSSGFSFRSLEMVKQPGCHYIDTDLPEVIELKKDFLKELKLGIGSFEGKLELIPLNVLDDTQFHEIVSHFPPGEVVIVNEGLLMYLDTEEKATLCRIIHNILKERGGYWITADIYIQKPPGDSTDSYSPYLKSGTKEFYQHHHIEENKFENFEQAKVFFNKMGLVIDNIAHVDRSTLSSRNYLLQHMSNKEIDQIYKAARSQVIWRLKVADI